jgi:hypothetical protein
MILEETTHGPTADRHRGCDDSPHLSSEEAATKLRTVIIRPPIIWQHLAFTAAGRL